MTLVVLVVRHVPERLAIARAVLAPPLLQHRRVQRLHDVVTARVAAPAEPAHVVVVDQAEHAEAEVATDDGEEARQLRVRAADARQQLEVTLRREGVAEGARRQHRDVPGGGEASDRRHRRVANGPDEGVHGVVQVHVDGGVRPRRVRAARVGGDHPQRHRRQHVRPVVDRRHRRFDRRQRRRQRPRVARRRRQDNGERHIVAAHRNRRQQVGGHGVLRQCRRPHAAGNGKVTSSRARREGKASSSRCHHEDKASSSRDHHKGKVSSSRGRCKGNALSPRGQGV